MLGQGDFIQCLMDALGAELDKNASDLYRHNCVARAPNFRGVRGSWHMLFRKCAMNGEDKTLTTLFSFRNIVILFFFFLFRLRLMEPCGQVTHAGTPMMCAIAWTFSSTSP